ncbi:MAG: O-antigen ligase family protein [Thermoguttaceae bacterium]|jgi:O-antigen ligase
MMIQDPNNMTKVPAMDARFLALAIVAVAACFFMADHNLLVSRLEDYADTPERMIAMAAGGNLARRLASFGLAGFGLFCLLRPAGRPFGPGGLLGALLVGYFGWCSMSLAWSADPAMTARRLLVLACWMLGGLGIARQCSLRDLTVLAAAVCTLYLAIGIVAEVTLGTFRPLAADYRFAGSLHPNSQGLNLAVLSLAAFSLAYTDSGVRKLPCLLLAVAIVFLILTKSRASAGGALAGLAAIWWLRTSLRTKVIVAPPAVAAISAAALVLSLAEFDLVKGFGTAATLGRSEELESLTGRLPLWQHLTEYMMQRPLQGYGYDTFWTPQHLNTLATAMEWGVPDAHSSYLETVLTLGIVGVVLLVGAVVAATWRAGSEFARRRTPGYDFLVGACLLSLVNGFIEAGMLMPTRLAAFILVCGIVHATWYRADASASSYPADRETETVCEPSALAGAPLP